MSLRDRIRKYMESELARPVTVTEVEVARELMRLAWREARTWGEDEDEMNELPDEDIWAKVKIPDV